MDNHSNLIYILPGIIFLLLFFYAIFLIYKNSISVKRNIVEDLNDMVWYKKFFMKNKIFFISSFGIISLISSIMFFLLVK